VARSASSISSIVCCRNFAENIALPQMIAGFSWREAKGARLQLLHYSAYPA
jgi:hypothetical protein